MNVNKLTEIIRSQSLIDRGDRVIIGVSGGPDSVALLCLLSESDLDLTLLPVYVDHGLRPTETKKEKALVEELSKRYHLKHEIVSVDVRGHRQHHKTSLEESARILRYQALEEQRQKQQASLIVVAHTADDQMEEFFLRLFRGSGAKGLSGMAMKSGRLVRPLLSTPKRDLLEYLQAEEIEYCLDSSNEDLTIFRNSIRHELVPFIVERYNPSLRETLLQTMEILGDDDTFLERIVQQKMRECFHHFQSPTTSSLLGELQLSPFCKEDLAIQRRLLEKIIWLGGSRPSFHHIETIIALADRGKIGSEYHLPQGLRVVISSDKLRFFHFDQRQKSRGSLKSPELQPVAVQCDKRYVIPELSRQLILKKHTHPVEEKNRDIFLLDYEKMHWPLEVRSPLPGERFVPLGMQGSKKISRFLADAKIPRHDRYAYPILLSGNTIVAVLGLRPDAFFAADDTTRKWLEIRWLPLPLGKKDASPT